MCFFLAESCSTALTSAFSVPDQAALVTANISGMKLSPKESKRLVRKIDRWLMPLLCLVYMIQFVSISVPSQLCCGSRAFRRAVSAGLLAFAEPFRRACERFTDFSGHRCTVG